MSNPLEREFLFVTGKGGVGKTTVSAALAIAAASQGRRVLLAMVNARERLSEVLGTPRIGPHEQQVLPGIDAVNMQPQAALEEYGTMILKVRVLYRALFENRVVSAFLHGTPGIDAWSMLGKAYYHTTQHQPDGSHRYDLVIVDGPATGHALDMLRVPRVLIEVAPPGLLRREAKRAWELMTDPKRSAMVLVTLPEEMPTAESIELDAALRELELPLGCLVINRVLPTLFSASQAQWLRQIAPLDSPHALGSLLAAGKVRAARQDSQATSMGQLRDAIQTPLACVPELFLSQLDQAALEHMARLLEDCLRTTRARPTNPAPSWSDT